MCLGSFAKVFDGTKRLHGQWLGATGPVGVFLTSGKHRARQLRNDSAITSANGWLGSRGESHEPRAPRSLTARWGFALRSSWLNPSHPRFEKGNLIRRRSLALGPGVVDGLARGRFTGIPSSYGTAQIIPRVRHVG